jgi:hypothetical protein
VLLDDKHYEQDVYDPEGEFKPPPPAASPVPPPESPEARANRAMNRNFALLGVFVLACGAAWFIPAVSMLVFCFFLAAITIVVLFVAIGGVALFDRENRRERRLNRPYRYRYWTSDMQRSERRESYVFATFLVVGVFILVMLKAFASK